MNVRGCSQCGTTAEVEDDEVPLGWSLGTERGRMTWLCPACARTHVRAIEGKLPEEYW